MRVMKKLIAACSALAMAATMFSAFVVQAASEPVVKLNLNSTSEGVYDLAVNVDTTGCALGNKVGSFQISFNLDETKFDMKNGPLATTWDEDAEEDVYNNIVYGKSKYAGGSWTYKNNKFTYAFSDTTGKGQAQSTPTDIITLKGLKLLSGVETEDIAIDIVDFYCEVGNGSSNQTSYGVAAQKPANVMDSANLIGATFPGNKVTPAKPSVPTNTGATADSSAILNVKPSDVGGTGDVWASADGSENAVAGLANFTPSAATSTIEWTISATPVGGEATQYTKAFDLGASIDAAATIGLIVNYNTAEYSSVSIVSGALK